MSMNFSRILELSGKKLSEEQLQAVYSDKATIVSAGAGSGKTTVLSLRFLKLMVEDHIDADRILTITFTKKAAAEMHERIHNLLSLAAKEDDEMARQLKEKFPNAVISTMDSFWTEIARSGALKYGISRDFELEEADDRARIVDRVLATLALSDEVKAGYDLLSSSNVPAQFRDIFNNIAARVNILSSFPAEKTDAGYSFMKELVCNEDVVNRMGQLLGMLEAYSGEAAANPKSYFASGDFNKATRAYLDGRYLNIPKIKKTPNAIKKPTEEFKNIVEEYNELLPKLKQYDQMVLNESYQKEVSVLIDKFIKEYQKEKRKRCLLSFSDIQAIAKEVLISDINVRNYYKNRFDYIMVDEFQDNNLEQRNLLYLLSERVDLAGDRIPEARDLDPKKLFFVGDDKQSIYRFRGADVSVFNSLKGEVEDDMHGNAITLGANYRSQPKLVEHFNNVFQVVFDKRDTGTGLSIVDKFRNVMEGEYRANPSEISAGRERSEVNPLIEIDILPNLPKKNREPGLLDDNDSEAEFIADRIKKICTGNELRVSGGKKPVFGDICILYGKSGMQMHLEKALRHHGIPYNVVESTSSTLEGIAYDIFSMLHLIVYPKDRLSFISLLNSPFARISSSGQSFLLNWDKERLEGFYAFSDEVTFEDESDKKSYESIKAFYEEVSSLAGHIPMTALLDKIFYESGYYTYLVSSSNIAVYLEHYSYLWTLAKNADEDKVGLVGFLDMLRPLVGHSSKLENISIQSLDGEGVKLMTIHKSKGLEFPIVILAGSGSTYSKRPQSIISTERNGEDFLLYDISDNSYVLSENDIEEGYSLPFASPFNEWTEERLSAERRRLLYVALTRAVDHLIVVAAMQGEKSKAESLFSIYNEYLKIVDDDVSDDDITLQIVPRLMEDQLRFRVRDYRDRSWYDNASPATKCKWEPKKAAAKDSSHSDDDNIELGERLPMISADDILYKERSYRTGFGSWVHEALEQKLTGKNTIRPFESDVPIDEKDKEVLLKSALAIADSFTDSNFYKKYVEGKEIQSEVGFFYKKENIVLQGSADLIVLGDEYNLIIDYKTDKYKTPEQHKGQITTYIKAFESLYGKKCYGKLCYVRDFSEGPLWDRDGNEL